MAGKTKSNTKNTFQEINNGFTGAFALLNICSCVKKVHTNYIQCLSTFVPYLDKESHKESYVRIL